MNRPYTICHIFCALDGAIVGNYMYAPETTAAREQYGKLRATFNSNAILYGTTTMLDFCDGYVDNLKASQPINREDYIVASQEKNYVIAIDSLGKLAYSNNCLVRHGIKQQIIVVLSTKVEDAYLQYLQQLKISYIFAGETSLDCEIIMKKLKEKFGIERLLIAGGGYTDWAFADAGMIDELSLVLAPAADGEHQVSVFQRNESSRHSSITFTLKEVQQVNGNGVWLRYTFNNAKK
ncbi:MAG: dihydrofolate reductase family protein [Anaeroplasmataceae bacterium]|nr:dihydrofolate reductase family protein [Anaeroplasmataceae bacterium]